jgi:hypothetical protein
VTEPAAKRNHKRDVLVVATLFGLVAAWHIVSRRPPGTWWFFAALWPVCALGHVAIRFRLRRVQRLMWVLFAILAVAAWKLTAG